MIFFMAYIDLHKILIKFRNVRHGMFGLIITNPYDLRVLKVYLVIIVELGISFGVGTLLCFDDTIQSAILSSKLILIVLLDLALVKKECTIGSLVLKNVLHRVTLGA